jgi:hypothetical protein
LGVPVLLLPVDVVAPAGPVVEPGVVVEVPEPGSVDGMLVDVDGAGVGSAEPVGELAVSDGEAAVLPGVEEAPKVLLLPVPVTPLPPTPAVVPPGPADAPAPAPPTDVPGPAEVPPALTPAAPAPALPPADPPPACANANPGSASGAATMSVCTILRMVMAPERCNWRATFERRLELRYCRRA